MVLGHAAAGRRFGGRGGRGGWWGASVGGGAAQFRRRGELGLAPSENRRIGQQSLTKYPYAFFVAACTRRIKLLPKVLVPIIMVNCDGVSYFDAVWAFLNIFAYRFRLTSGD